MDINLKVSPAELEAKATDFKGVMSQIKTLTDDMMADVTGLSSTWTGDETWEDFIKRMREFYKEI